MEKRIEKDSLGEVEVPAKAYWGAQTERSLLYFNIGHDKMPKALIRAYGLLKWAAAEANCELGYLTAEKAGWIKKASEEVMEGKLDGYFPLSIWQTGSGTQTNMNVNEVIANLAIEFAGGKMGSKAPIHPNDDVNCSQSSNDTFPTVMHMAAVREVKERLLPRLHQLLKALQKKEKEFAHLIKIGRTHLMDALPITLGGEFASYAEQIRQDIERVEMTLPHLYELAIGATACGTGYLAPPHFAERVVDILKEKTALPFALARNKMAQIASHDPFVFASGALKTTASSLIKIATDLSWMGSGPRAGLAELFLPENEPGSSIMPGKINPTQCEALIMVSTQVYGNDLAISMAASRGNFELNVYKPLIIHNFLHSVDLLSDALHSFTNYFIEKLQPNEEKLKRDCAHSLMLVTALRPAIGYDKAAEIALKAYHEGTSLKEAALSLNILSEKELDLLLDPKKMTE